LNAVKPDGQNQSSGTSITATIARISQLSNAEINCQKQLIEMYGSEIGVKTAFQQLFENGLPLVCYSHMNQRPFES
jgi:hypothetical protein